MLGGVDDAKFGLKAVINAQPGAGLTIDAGRVGAQIVIDYDAHAVTPKNVEIMLHALCVTRQVTVKKTRHRIGPGR